MKTLFLFIALFLLSPVARADAPPKFDTLKEFLAWADTKLGSDDYDGLASAQVASKDHKETRIAYIKKLDVDFSDGSLSKIFKGRNFPADKTKLKLGGHNKELGHCHIDFVKVKGHWQLARIWQCR